MAKRSHKEMSLEDKIALIRASEASPKPTQAHLSCQFSIGRSTVGDILRKKRLYEEAWEGNVYSKRQRLSKTTNAEAVNEKLYAFFNQARAKNIPISGPILQSKALQFAEELDVEDFRASNGWLDAWKKRYNIKQFKISGESADVNCLYLKMLCNHLSLIFHDFRMPISKTSIIQQPANPALFFIPRRMPD